MRTAPDDLPHFNAEQSPATHYDPDPITRDADLSVDGGPARRVLFPTTLRFDDFWEPTVPVALKKGTNRCAPVIDRVSVTPLAQK